MITYMYDIKLFAKNEKELENLVQTTRLRRGKRRIKVEIELPKKKSERFEKWKLTNTWEYWKRTPLNKRR